MLEHQLRIIVRKSGQEVLHRDGVHLSGLDGGRERRPNVVRARKSQPVLGGFNALRFERGVNVNAAGGRKVSG